VGQGGARLAPHVAGDCGAGRGGAGRRVGREDGDDGRVGREGWEGGSEGGEEVSRTLAAQVEQVQCSFYLVWTLLTLISEVCVAKGISFYEKLKGVAELAL